MLPEGEALVTELCLGVGFTTSATTEDIVAAITAVVPARASVVVLATVSAKAASPPLVDAAAVLHVPIVSFDADQLARVEVPSPSAAARRAVGTASVAEASAILAAGGGPLEVAKTARNGVVVAAARKVSSSVNNFDDETECE